MEWPGRLRDQRELPHQTLPAARCLRSYLASGPRLTSLGSLPCAHAGRHKSITMRRRESFLTHLRRTTPCKNVADSHSVCFHSVLQSPYLLSLGQFMVPNRRHPKSLKALTRFRRGTVTTAKRSTKATARYLVHRRRTLVPPSVQIGSGSCHRQLGNGHGQRQQSRAGTGDDRRGKGKIKKEHVQT